MRTVVLKTAILTNCKCLIPHHVGLGWESKIRIRNNDKVLDLRDYFRMKIRQINKNSKEEISLVAYRMKKTLIDVMGEEKGSDYYSDDWLLSRVQYHIDLEEMACIFLSEEENGEISGQAIIRIEQENNIDFGFFSTIYVSDDFRRKGIAKELIKSVLEWCHEKGVSKITYNTAENHSPIISLFKQFGFKEILHADNMVKLALSFN